MTTCYNFKKWELAMQEEGRAFPGGKKKGRLSHRKAERERTGQRVWSRGRKATEQEWRPRGASGGAGGGGSPRPGGDGRTLPFTAGEVGATGCSVGSGPRRPSLAGWLWLQVEERLKIKGRV